MNIDPSTIPQDLTARPQWVVWRYENRNGKSTKVPYDAKTGLLAESNNPMTWADYAVARKAEQRGGFDGVGYVFSADDPFVGIDLDKCIDGETIAPWAITLLRSLNSYAEVSPSGTGIKMWVAGTIPTSAKPRRAKVPTAIIPADAPGNIEMYASGRFFTVTGRHVPVTPRTIQPANGALMSLYELLRPTPIVISASPRTTARPAGRAYLERWASRKFDYAVERVRAALDGERHNERFAMARLLGGLIPHGLATESEIARALFDAQPPKTAAQRSEYKTILDAIAIGAQSPLTLPDAPEQPIFDSVGAACCPKHKRILSAAKNGNGYTCHARDKSTENGWCRYWWDGDGYMPPKADDPSTETPNPAAPPIVPSRRSDAIIQALSGLGYTFRLNQCSDTIEVNGEMMDDVMEATIYTQMRDIDIKGRATMRDTWITEAAKHAYHPIREYLTAHEWDGEPHIERLAACLVCADPPVVYPSGESVSLAGVYLWRWMVGAVAKVFEQAQNLMLVIAGPQGTGKSHLARWLCSGIPRHFIEAPIMVGDRDTDVRLMNHFLWEVSELDATTRKADVSALKAFITKQVVSARKAYGHHDTVKPACASLIGTVNNGSGFLADETGNRRFYVTTIESIDWAYTKIDVNQLWAQAVALYRGGEPWQLQPDEYTSQSEVNKQHEVDGLLDDWIDRHFLLDVETSAMSAAEIVDHLRTKHEIRLGGSERAQAMEVARVMVKFGIRRRQRSGRGVREYVGVCPKNP